MIDIARPLCHRPIVVDRKKCSQPTRPMLAEQDDHAKRDHDQRAAALGTASAVAA